MDKNQEILKKYICTTPFVYLEAHKNGIYSCCPSWLPNKISNLEDIETAWESEELKKVQESILDGSYKYCSKTQCPYLSELLINKTIPKGFIPKEDFKSQKYKQGPTNINFAFDRSCNLTCPSCRNVAIMADGTELEFIDDTINKIVDIYGKNIKMLYLSGTADPFASKSIRKLLLNFDRNKFPNVNHIHLHTNALLLTEKMWNSLSHIHDLIKTIEISIDAANEDTYKIVRRGGDWQTLLNNLNFISTIKLNNKNVSFVTQDTNYMEMEDFYILMNKIFKNNINVFFNKITNWGTYTPAEFSIKQIWNESHPEFQMFLLNLNKINKKYKCTHNMHDIINKHLPIKISGLI
jgi:MoaA/NifB/PqqE/SkfB family radical SAM enzyme